MPRPGPLTFGPGAPAAPSLSNAGTAFPSPPEAAPAFPSLAGRATAASPSPGTALPALPRLGQAPVRFPAGGRHEPCLVSGKEARLCPALPFCRARRQGCTPRQKQKARPPPKGWPDRCVSLSGDEAQVSDQALGLPNWQSLLPESEVHISSIFRGSL